VAQMSDARTAVGLAHSEGIDLRFFLNPPNWHLSPSKEVILVLHCILNIGIFECLIRSNIFTVLLNF
jgi:hypothetical protein